MNILFYNNSSSDNVLNKTLSNDTSIECYLKEYSNLSNLTIRLNYSIDDFNFNYCYIEKFNRYYFIKNITIERNNLINIELEIDVLMSYKENILNSSGEIIETSDNSNSYDYENTNDFETIEYNLDNPFTEKSNILITVQGA